MESTNTNIFLAVLSFLGLGCGLSLSILVTELTNFIEDRLEDGYPAVHVITPIALKNGLAYIIPGLVGMVACCVRRKRMYVGHMVLAMVILGILAVFFVMGGTASGLKAEGPYFCEMTNTGCSCENKEIRTLLKYFSCSEINMMVRIGISTNAMFWGGGVITLITAILSGVISASASLKTTPETTSQTKGQGYLPHVAFPQFSSNPYKHIDK